MKIGDVATYVRTSSVISPEIVCRCGVSAEKMKTIKNFC